MKDIIERDDGDREFIMLGDKLPVSMKAVQSIYNELTGKTETIGQVLSGDHEIDYNDIQQLNFKILQMYEQYSVLESNCCITIYHVNDSKEQFSSFERFSMYEKGSKSPCENIRIEYSFLIILPATKQPQAYKIKIDLHSRAALKNKAQSEMGFNRRVIQMVSMRSGYIEIDYVDYTVARNFGTAINEWYSGVKKNKGFMGYGWLQDHSHKFQAAFSHLSLLVLFAVAYLNSSFLVPESSSLHQLFVAIISVFFSAVFIGYVAGRFGSACESLIDMYAPVSGLRLNKGDEEVMCDQVTSNRRMIVGGVFFMLMTIALNISSSHLFIWLGVGS